MYVAALIVEELDYDGCLRTLRMQGDPRDPLKIAFADELNEPHSGPFHFLEEHHRETFEKSFAECKAWKLSKSHFFAVEGEYRFQTSWQGIPTGKNCLSCYSLSLPKFAVPTEIRFHDPRSGREYLKSVVRDDRRERFVAYLECRSRYGLFDFLLRVTFRSDSDNFPRAEYIDGHMTRHEAQIHAYKDLLPTHFQPFVQPFVRQFLSRKVRLPQRSATKQHFLSRKSRLTRRSAAKRSQLELELGPSVTLISADRVEIIGERSVPQNSTEPKGSKPKLLDKLPPKVLDFSKYIDGARLTDAQYEVAKLKFEHKMPIAKIARRLGKNRASIQERLAAAEKKIRKTFSSERQAQRRAIDPD